MATGKQQDGEQAYISGTPVSTTDWEKHELGFNSKGWVFRAVGGAFLEWSWDGKEVHGRLEADEREEFDQFHKGTIWLRGDSAAKIWAWV